MKAAILNEGAASLTVEDVDVSAVGAHEVLIQTAAAGLCHSDLYHLRGVFDIPRPTILGHESAGTVLQVGSEVRDLSAGDHVITSLSPFCGRCERCLAGRSHLCRGAHAQRSTTEAPRLSRAGSEVHQFLNVSSFAEQLLVHETATVKIDRAMPLALAALIGCGVTTGMGAVFNTAKVRPGETVAVIGCGGIGLSAIQAARVAGASRVFAVDLQTDKLQVAQKLGATDVLNAGDGDVGEALKDLTGGGVDHCVEAVGSPRTAETALKTLAVGGTATIVGLMPGGQTFPVQGRLLLDDRKLQGCYMGGANHRLVMPRYVEMYLAGRLLLDEMVSSRISLDGIDAAFQSMEEGHALRDLVVF